MTRSLRYPRHRRHSKDFLKSQGLPGKLTTWEVSDIVDILSDIEVIDPNGHSQGPITGLVVLSAGKCLPLREVLHQALEEGFSLRSIDKE